jgi:hypothetical protein
MVNMMGKEMGRTCRAAHSALLRRVVGRRLQSFAVGWGCPSHWTRLPSLLSANMRLPLGIVDYYQADERIAEAVCKDLLVLPRWCPSVRALHRK